MMVLRAYLRNFIGFAILAGSILAACDGVGAKQICHITSAPAQLFVDSTDALWFASGADAASQIARVRFPCQIKTFTMSDVHPNAFAENASGIWFTEFLGKSINGEWLEQLGHVDKKMRLHQVSLGRVSASAPHAGGIIARGDDLWVAQPGALVRYTISTRQTTRFYPQNTNAVLLGPAPSGNALWFVDANAMTLLAFNVMRGKFSGPIRHPAVYSGPPTAQGKFLYYADWNTGQVTKFNTRTHERARVKNLIGVNTLSIRGNCSIAVQDSKVNVYNSSMQRVASYDENKGLSLPGGLAVSGRFIYFSTFAGIIRESLPRQCSS